MRILLLAFAFLSSSFCFAEDATSRPVLLPASAEKSTGDHMGRREPANAVSDLARSDSHSSDLTSSISSAAVSRIGLTAVIIILLLVWWIPALIPAYIAASKGSSFVGIFFLTLLVGWPVMIPVALVMPYPPNFSATNKKAR